MSEIAESSEDSRRAFAEIFDTHYPKVAAFVRRRVMAHDADDVVAEVFLVAWRQIDALPVEPLPWLYQVAKHAIANLQRGAFRRQRLAERAVELRVVDEEEEPLGEEWAGGFSIAFASLGDKDQEILRLTVVEQMSTAEGAALLGCSPGAFKVRTHRARTRLRRLIEADQSARLSLFGISATTSRSETEGQRTDRSQSTSRSIPLALEENY